VEQQNASKSKPNNPFETIERASSILDILGRSPQGVSICELSGEIKLPKGTIHHLLSSLSCFGYVRQDPKTRNYLLGEAKRDIRGRAKIEVRFFD